MVKQLIVLFNLLSFIIVTALLPADIRVDTKIPEDATFVMDSTYIIEVDITKGPIFGFAKYQQNIPDGYIAQPVETSEASFTFADGKIKFIWMAIPEQEIVKISYALTATQDAKPEGFLAGKLSYIEDNERKSYDIPQIAIKAVSDAPVVAKIPAVAEVSRSVTNLGGNEYQVDLKIVKSGVEGFGKLEEYLPEGAEAAVKVNDKAVFSQVDNKAKFVWMAVPNPEEVVVSYTVKSETDIETALSAMEGNFSFLDDNETKTVAVLGGAPIASEAVVAVDEAEENTESSTASVVEEIVEETVEEAEEVATVVETETESTDALNDVIAEKVKEANEAADEESEEIADAVEEKVETVVPEPKEAVTQSKEEVVERVEEKASEELVADNGSTKIPNPETGVSYKVQIAAGKKVVSNEFIKKVYNFREQFGIENHEGWVKYTTGSFDVYKGARDKREALVSAGHNFPGPFVTAYNSGQRITVQEALMISNQKWFK